MVVILDDDEAENVAQILRRTFDHAVNSPMVFVDDRGPHDFAEQLEALVDAGDPNVYVVMSALDRTNIPIASVATLTRTAAEAWVDEHGGDGFGVQKVPVRDPRKGDDTVLVADGGGENDGPKWFQSGPFMRPVPEHATRDSPLSPPDFDDYRAVCPDCGADGDPWVGDDVFAVHFDVTTLPEHGIVPLIEGKCTCGFEDRVLFGVT